MQREIQETARAGLFDRIPHFVNHGLEECKVTKLGD